MAAGGNYTGGAGWDAGWLTFLKLTPLPVSYYHMGSCPAIRLGANRQ
jgi:hypothetical protein